MPYMMFLVNLTKFNWAGRVYDMPAKMAKISRLVILILKCILHFVNFCNIFFLLDC